MKYRIAMWAFAGLLVAGGWWLYIFATAPIPISVATPTLWALARLSCPIVLAGFYFHFGVSIYWVLIANAATYAWIGLIVETMRRLLHHAR
ncbi:MAG: hypothetical protein WA628_17555 [Terriglobales bacterium]